MCLNIWPNVSKLQKACSFCYVRCVKTLLLIISCSFDVYSSLPAWLWKRLFHPIDKMKDAVIAKLANQAADFYGDAFKQCQYKDNLPKVCEGHTELHTNLKTTTQNGNKHIHSQPCVKCAERCIQSLDSVWFNVCVFVCVQLWEIDLKVLLLCH